MSTHVEHSSHHTPHHKKRAGFTDPEHGLAEVVHCGNGVFPTAYVYYVCKQAIDVDGAPNAYNVHDVGKSRKQQLGLDSPVSAMAGGKWSANVVLMKHGEPETDEQGFCYAMTTLTAGLRDPKNRENYVDAVRIPYFVLPKHPPEPTQHGSFAYFLSSNGGSGGAIFADSGPGTALGEVSLKLAGLLTIKGSARGVASTQSVFGIVFPGSGAGKPKNTDGAIVDAAGHAKFTQWGGMNALKEAVDQMSVHAKADYALACKHGAARGATDKTVA